MDIYHWRHHGVLFTAFIAVVLLHFSEHIAQMWQIHGHDTTRPMAMGFLGELFPWGVRTEAMHFGFAAFMFAGVMWFSPRFAWYSDMGNGVPLFWWVALGLFQLWHLTEHTILLTQYLLDVERISLGTTWFGIQRAELHFTYSAIALLLMFAAQHAAFMGDRWWRRQRTLGRVDPYLTVGY